METTGFFQFEIIIDRLYVCGTASHWSMNVCTNINKMVNLIKSHDNLHGITYRIKIMLKGIAIVKTLDIALKYHISDYYVSVSSFFFI